MMEGWGKIWDKQRQFMTDGSKEITGNDTLKSIVQVNNQRDFLRQSEGFQRSLCSVLGACCQKIYVMP